MEPTLHIDGTKEFGYSTVNRYLYSFYLFMNTVKRVCERYNYASVLDLRGYAAHFCYLRFKCFDTFIKVVLVHKDYVTANCILRMLGDSVSVFHLIYMEKDVELRRLRHALYVLEGCEKNLENLTVEGVNEGTMPPEELEREKSATQYNIEHRQRLMREAQQILGISPLKEQDEKAFDKIVNDKNWKFKEFKSYTHIKNNQYSWHDLYEKIGRCEHFDLLSYISQYVHALSMSNLVTRMNRANRDGVICEALGLITQLNNDALEFFKSDFQYIMEGLLLPDMRDKILACFDDKHRPEIPTWEASVAQCLKNYYYGRVERI